MKIKLLILIIMLFCSSIAYSADFTSLETGRQRQPSDTDGVLSLTGFTFIGRTYDGSADILYNSAVVNEFLLSDKNSKCNSEYNICTSSKEIKSLLVNSIGKQVMLFGEKQSVPVQELKKENESSIYLKALTDMNFSFLNVEKIQPVEFYKAIVPDKIDWKNPVKIKLHFENPLKQNVKLYLNIYSLDSHYKYPFTLEKEEKKDIEIDYDLSKVEWARSFGTSIVLDIKMDSSESGNYLIFFSDKIASYNSDGELISPEE